MLETTGAIFYNICPVHFNEIQINSAFTCNYYKNCHYNQPRMNDFTQYYATVICL